MGHALDIFPSGSVFGQVHRGCAACPFQQDGKSCAFANDNFDADLSKVFVQKRFRAGSPVSHEDHPQPSLAILAEGVVKLTRSLPGGNQQIVGLLLPGDLLGSISFDKHHESAQCAADAIFCCFPLSKITLFSEKYPKFERFLLDRYCDSLYEAREWMLTLGARNSRQKVSAFLVWLLKKARQRKLFGDLCTESATINCPLDRADIANLLGITVETVCRQITSLKRRGVIATQGHRRITICDEHALKWQAWHR